MVIFKKVIAELLALIGVFVFIGAAMQHRGPLYMLEYTFFSALFLVPAFLLWRSAKKTERNRKTTLENSILKTKIIDASSKKSASSTIARGVAGGAVGGLAGTVVGASLGKTNRETTFLVLFRDGTKKTITVQNDSPEYLLYCKFLEM